MRKLLAGLAFLVVPAFVPLNAPAGVVEVLRFQLVGFTTETFRGDEGMFAYTFACQEQFGATSRMCNTLEVAQTTQIPDLPVGPAAWVHFVPPGSGAEDASIGSAARSNCNGWSSTSSSGVIVGASGKLSSVGCSVAVYVACCSPVADGSAPEAGDVNGDGIVNLVDSVVLRRQLAGEPVDL